MHRVDGAGATGTGQWTLGDPTTGVPATEFTADFMNAVQNELENVIVTGAAIALNKASNSQLLLAIQTIITGLAGSFTPNPSAGASHTYAAADRGLFYKRTHSGSMTDTLPGTSPGVLASGFNVVIANTSAAQTLAVAPGAGATINGSGSSVSVAAGTSKRFVSDGSNYYTVG